MGFESSLYYGEGFDPHLCILGLRSSIFINSWASTQVDLSLRASILIFVYSWVSIQVAITLRALIHTFCFTWASIQVYIMVRVLILIGVFEDFDPQFLFILRL